MAPDRAAKSLAVDAGQVDARIGQGLGGGLAAQRNVLQLTRGFSFDIDGRAEHQAIGYSRYAGQSAHAAVAALNCLPNGLAVSADRRNHADAGDNYRLVLGMGRLH
jgi:hypothetical protein